MATYNPYDEVDQPTPQPPAIPTPSVGTPGMPVPPTTAPTTPANPYTGTTQHNVAGGKATKDEQGFWAIFNNAQQGTQGTTTDLQNLVSNNPLLEAQIVGGSRGDVQLPSWAGGQTWDVVYGAGGPQAQQRWQRVQDRGGNPGSGSASGSTAGQVFTDPATSQWEQMLRQLVARMNQPQPEYTPAQLELLQTQALDPMTQRRDAMRRQVMERFAARGIGPGSGILEQALQDIDRQFNRLATQTQGAFAAQNIARGDQRFAGDEARAMQALGLMFQIPQLADSRFQMAQGSMLNPFAAFGNVSNFYNQQQQNQLYQQQQSQQYWNQIAQLIASALNQL
jgi:hypothetical protein